MLLESYVNLIDDKKAKERYFDEVWDLLQKAYTDLGGVKGTDRNEMMQDNVMWKLSKKGGKVVACQIYKFTDNGRKVVLGGAIKDPETGKTDAVGKQELYKIIQDEVALPERMSYVEVSDAMEHIYVDKYGATVIPAKEVAQILAKSGKKVKIEDDGIHYTRLISGTPITKVMVGYPKKES